MPRYNKQEDFEFGLAQVAPFFDSLGFLLSRDKPYTDKPGTSYSARFIRPPRSVELNHLYSLGPVIYSIREFSMEHTFYTQALGLTAAAQFPRFVDDSVSGYPALLHDLENLLPPFFSGPEDDFVAIAKRYMQAQQQQHEDDSRDLSYHATGEDRLKARARELFREGRYEEVLQIESKIKFTELLTPSERQLFTLAKKRR
jgi:catechol 2,3-dioxygenase-like lactoylglutathione lyase family enzyme